MKSCGVIATYITRQDWQGKKFLPKVGAIFFNCKLFVGQLTFMIVGTAYGKIKWEKLERWQDRAVNTIVVWSFLGAALLTPKSWNIPVFILLLFVVISTFYRHMDWRRVWRAAQVSHVRLVLKEWDAYRPDRSYVYECMNFGYPKATIQLWRMDMIDDKRFRYFKPTFPTPPKFMEPVIQYAEDQVGKKYDEVQLISSGLHLIVWIVYPWSWGKELKIIKAFNRKGGREHCISGVTACLRWADWKSGGLLIGRDNTNFFPGYSTATTFPCQVELSKNWKQT